MSLNVNMEYQQETSLQIVIYVGLMIRFLILITQRIVPDVVTYGTKHLVLKR